MTDSHLPKQIFYSELSDGTRKVGKPRKRFKDNLKENLKQCDLNYKTWETDALERSVWRAKVKSGFGKFEKNRRQHLENRRAAGLACWDYPQPTLPPDNTCPNCDRVCGSRIGLISHMRTHQ